jgi:hypothetical protein
MVAMGKGTVSTGHEADLPAGSNSPLTLYVLDTPGAVE